MNSLSKINSDPSGLIAQKNEGYELQASSATKLVVFAQSACQIANNANPY